MLPDITEKAVKLSGGELPHNGIDMITAVDALFQKLARQAHSHLMLVSPTTKNRAEARGMNCSEVAWKKWGLSVLQASAQQGLSLTHVLGRGTRNIAVMLLLKDAVCSHLVQASSLIA
jgi:hypothetical protein